LIFFGSLEAAAFTTVLTAKASPIFFAKALSILFALGEIKKPFSRALKRRLWML
jgi:hypothetical protein